jgi:hypothetical protein
MSKRMTLPIRKSSNYRRRGFAAAIAVCFTMVAGGVAQAMDKSDPRWAEESSRYHSCSAACNGNGACIVRCAQRYPPGRDAPSAATSGHGSPGRHISYDNCIADECSSLQQICYQNHLASACDANTRCMTRCAQIHGGHRGHRGR